MVWKGSGLLIFRDQAGRRSFNIHKKRELREKLYKAYINRGNNNNEFDNKEIIKKIVALRIEKAKLLGYETYAHFKLEKNMAKTPENVLKFFKWALASFNQSGKSWSCWNAKIN